MVVIVWEMVLQQPVQSVPITTNVVSSNPDHRCRDGRLVIYLDTCHFWCEYKAKIKWINQKWIQRGCCTQSLSTICIIYGDYLAKLWWFNLLYRTKNTRLDQKKSAYQPSVPTPMCLLWYNFTKFLHNFNIDDNTILCFIRFYIFWCRPFLYFFI
jgi:hypothetical protein